jgi:hypothetical protein
LQRQWKPKASLNTVHILVSFTGNGTSSLTQL